MRITKKSTVVESVEGLNGALEEFFVARWSYDVVGYLTIHYEKNRAPLKKEVLAIVERLVQQRPWDKSMPSESVSAVVKNETDCATLRIEVSPLDHLSKGQLRAYENRLVWLAKEVGSGLEGVRICPSVTTKVNLPIVEKK